MKIEVQETIWNGKMCYLGFLKYRDLSNVINIKEDLSMNRKVNPDRVDEICDYIKDNKERVFFPPVILNCSDKIKISNDMKSIKEIDINKKSLTIIDGQHRIYSIIKVLNKSCSNYNIKDNKIAFLLIEALEDCEHRALFNIINESSTNVEATVSARFKISYENLYGLRYIRLNMDKFKDIKLKDMVEWELKQSSEKICYIFITDINKYLLSYIKKNIKQQNDRDDYNIIDEFWNLYFEFIIDVEKDIRAFYVKKVVLRTLIDTILDNINNEEYKKEIEIRSYDELKNKIDTVLKDLLIKSFNEKYNGYYKQSKDTYLGILKYLINEKNKKDEEKKS